MSDLTFVELTPKPLACPHDRDGVPHASLSAILACLEAYGGGGFEGREVSA